MTTTEMYAKVEAARPQIADDIMLLFNDEWTFYAFGDDAATLARTYSIPVGPQELPSCLVVTMEAEVAQRTICLVVASGHRVAVVESM